FRSFFNATGKKFVGIDNYTALWSDELIHKSIVNNFYWVLVVPALITAIGLVFAVLTERISWAVAFKTAVFMPMAISLFAAGVVWRYFKPGGGVPGKVEPGEDGIPGVKVALKDPKGGTFATTTSADDGSFSFDGVKGTGYKAAISADTFRKPFGGVSWLGPRLVTPAVMIAYIWVWAGFAMV